MSTEKQTQYHLHCDRVWCPLSHPLLPNRICYEKGCRNRAMCQKAHGQGSQESYPRPRYLYVRGAQKKESEATDVYCSISIKPHRVKDKYGTSMWCNHAHPALQG